MIDCGHDRSPPSFVQMRNVRPLKRRCTASANHWSAYLLPRPTKNRVLLDDTRGNDCHDCPFRRMDACPNRPFPLPFSGLTGHPPVWVPLGILGKSEMWNVESYAPCNRVYPIYVQSLDQQHSSGSNHPLVL
jgi:hypothetical protein